MLIFENIDKEIKDVNTNPTEKQKEAGNYKKAHITVKGMKISIENPKGSKRYYGDGKYNVMKNHYGYFQSTMGKDGDEIDVFLGPDVDDFEDVYCIDQNTKDGKFDETKVMLGFNSKKEAKEAYLANYSKDWKGFRGITQTSLETFKNWLYRGRKQRQPFADYVMIKEMVERMVMGILDESREYYSDLIWRNPFVKLQFTNHCIERQYEREIFRGDIAYDVSRVIKQVIDDYKNGVIKEGEKFKVLNRETCLVSVCVYLPGKICVVRVLTAYLWDGRLNLGGSIYYVGEESDMYRDAVKWNAEHQDEVREYMKWRLGNYFGRGIEKQHRKAEEKYQHRNCRPELTSRKRLDWLEKAYNYKDRTERKAIHNALPPGDLEAIRQYFKDMDMYPLGSADSFNQELYDMDVEKRMRELERQQEMEK